MRSTWLRSIRLQQYLFNPRASRASLKWTLKLKIEHNLLNVKVNFSLTLLGIQLEEVQGKLPICFQWLFRKWNIGLEWSFWCYFRQSVWILQKLNAKVRISTSTRCFVFKFPNQNKTEQKLREIWERFWIFVANFYMDSCHFHKTKWSIK